MFGRGNSSNGNASRGGIFLEREGERRIEGILKAVDRTPWSVNLLQLAWTAGPVTFLAAQGGYYIGTKDFLPPDRLAFFIAYTIIAGIIGLVTTIAYDSYHLRKKDRRQRRFRAVIDRLPERIFGARDLAVASLPPEIRQREAAWLMLRKAELDPVALELLVVELTGSKRLAATARRVEFYRSNGMFQRARELLDEETDRIALAVGRLASEAPAMAETLHARLEGEGPTVKSGVPREDNFIERIFAAIEAENPALMTLLDVEEILLLAFELLSGREIPMLVFSYKGPWRMERATDALEKARSNYRIGQAMGYSRLKALISYLTESDAEFAEATAGQAQVIFLQMVNGALDALCDAIYELRVRVASGDLLCLDELEDKVSTLANALNLYRAMQNAYHELGQRHAALIRARQRWDTLTAQRQSPVTLRTIGGRAGLRISERTIRLTHEQKLKVADALAAPLLKRRNTERQEWTVESARDLAIEVALVLEEFVAISRPETQRAINSSNASLLADLDPRSGAGEKAAIGALVAAEVETDLGRAAEHLAAALVRHYRVALDDAAIRFLHRTYRADRQRLELLASFSEPRPSVPVSQLHSRPPAIPPINNRWLRQHRRGQRMLEQHGRALPVASV